MLGAPDDVAVGQDEPVSGDNHAGANAGAPVTSGGTRDADYRRTNPVDYGGDRTRIAIQRRIVPRVAYRVVTKRGPNMVEHRRNLKY